MGAGPLGRAAGGAADGVQGADQWGRSFGRWVVWLRAIWVAQ
ncbi:hypothetical protein H1P_6430010 [Hyella patelloides LEGE 07179]|uniref:Uncharacterized protein n=1 Tax=Hyella patelloides LEGE 07179 TaxID=945734 RepID=A0A563W262_9CYAN|nr:hypothetical protein H1P_6430010 [Hyella patelloides LEGE 07179]